MEQTTLQSHKTGTLLEALLKKRNITLEPDYERETHDPFLLTDMEKVVGRITKAVRINERIAIFSDYDTDGIPGAVGLHDFFKRIGFENFINYIPHRYEEGFGLNVGAIEKLAEDGVGLVVTIDCGSVDVKSVRRANELGVDVIITDHHQLNGERPKAYAIINPQQEGDRYPNKNICGAGVVYKVVQALVFSGDFDVQTGWEKNLLDMVGIATLSDMVELTGENRVFAYFGLHVLRRTARPGLVELLRKARTAKETLTEDDIAFTIAPRINAASRMDHPEIAFKMLSTKDLVEARDTVGTLSALNDERKGAVAAMVKEVHKKLSSVENLPDVIVLGNTHWRPGLVGLAANAVVETYGKTAFLWGREGSPDIKGSCRSDGSVDLVELMNELKNSFIEYGGHSGSGGFSVSNENIHTLEESLNKAYGKVSNGNVSNTNTIPEAALTLDDVNWSTYGQIEQLAPFGVGNPKPIFLFENVTPTAIRQFGKEKNHLELMFGGTKAISFFKKSEDFGLKEGESVNLYAVLERSVFMNKPELRLRIVDIE